MPRISLIHATPVAIDPVVDAFRRSWPEAEIYNLLEDSLAPDLERAGQLDRDMDQRFLRLARYAADCGADGILFTCSAFGTSIEKVARELAPLPVLKPNEAMFEEALRAGDRIGMIATFQPSVPSMEKEFVDLCADRGSTAILKSICVPDAMKALRAGDAETHNRLVAEAVSGFEELDALLLAHFSTAQAFDAVTAKTDLPVMTSPDSAVRALKALT